MKYFIILFYCLTFLDGTFAQSKVVNFYSAMTSVPMSKEIYIMDIKYKDGKFDSVKEQLIGVKRQNKNMREDYKLMGKSIDSLKLINYESDTIYILSTCYLPTSSVSMTFNTQKGTFFSIKNAGDEYRIQFSDSYYANLPEDVRTSDSLLSKAVFGWDIKFLIRLIKASGTPLGSEYSMTATRIILKDNQVVKKDILNFEPALRWHL